jgi:hypothetical protein
MLEQLIIRLWSAFDRLFALFSLPRLLAAHCLMMNRKYQEMTHLCNISMDCNIHCYIRDGKCKQFPETLYISGYFRKSSPHSIHKDFAFVLEGIYDFLSGHQNMYVINTLLRRERVGNSASRTVIWKMGLSDAQITRSVIKYRIIGRMEKFWNVDRSMDARKCRNCSSLHWGSYYFVRKLCDLLNVLGYFFKWGRHHDVRAATGHGDKKPVFDHVDLANYDFATICSLNVTRCNRKTQYKSIIELKIDCDRPIMTRLTRNPISKTHALVTFVVHVFMAIFRSWNRDKAMSNRGFRSTFVLSSRMWRNDHQTIIFGVRLQMIVQCCWIVVLRTAGRFCVPRRSRSPLTWWVRGITLLMWTHATTRLEADRGFGAQKNGVRSDTSHVRHDTTTRVWIIIPRDDFVSIQKSPWRAVLSWTRGRESGWIVAQGETLRGLHLAKRHGDSWSNCKQEAQAYNHLPSLSLYPPPRSTLTNALVTQINPPHNSISYTRVFGIVDISLF